MADKAFLFVDNEEVRLTADGLWLTNGEEITHEGTLKGFMKHLVRRGDGGFEVRIRHESKEVVVEDTAYFVRGLEGDASSGYTLLLNDDSREKLDPSTLSYRPGRLICTVDPRASRELGRRDEARFLSPSYFEILRGLQEDGRGYFLTIEGRRVDLAAKGEPA